MQSITHAPGEFHQSMTDSAKILAQGYMRIERTRNPASNYQVSGDGEDSYPIETIGINFGKIQWVYTVQKRAGGVSAGNIATGWNLERNSKA